MIAWCCYLGKVTFCLVPTLLSLKRQEEPALYRISARAWESCDTGRLALDPRSAQQTELRR